jgi:RHS repeat-associated protein
MLANYTPPETEAGRIYTQYMYNLSKQLKQILLPDDQAIDYNYDNSGRPVEVITPNGKIGYVFNDTTNNLMGIIANAESINYQYNGALLTDVRWSGTINGNIGIVYNNLFQIVNRNINGEYSLNYSYDKDGLLTGIGSLSLVRDSQNGRLSGTELGKISDIYDYDDLGYISSYSVNFNGNEIYRSSNTEIDDLGHIVSRTETVDGETVSYQYAYDALGQLREVYHNSALYSVYDYDPNGNRLSYKGPHGTTVGFYDNQDRMLSYGDNTYQYTENGELRSKTNGEGTTFYNYDVVGNLLKVDLPTGTTIDYIVDGRNRRIGKKINSVLKQGFIYQDQLKPIAELDGAGNVVTLFFYGTKTNVPDYIVKNGTTYRIITDHLGSVRLVIDAQSGEIAQKMMYDEFGNVLIDSNPAFQPFGFAGGLYDYQTGLVRFGARDYDAETGRWTSKDPIGFNGEDANLYRYVWNDPVNINDPSGQIAQILAGALIGAGTDLFIQLLKNDGKIGCINWGEVGLSAGVGALTGGLGSVLGRSGLTAGLKGLSNATKGDIGEGLSIAKNMLKGSKLIQPQAKIPGQTTIADSYWRAMDGTKYWVESKFGTSSLSPAQKAAQKALGAAYHVEKWTYPWVGEVGSTAGTIAGGTAGGTTVGVFSTSDCGCQ